ncbi:fimbrial protein [Xenorhabdus bovienii]|uniref:fimbrial protein n=1 Tax=Xenorhabdus bovienii TaxID=40576 RepID=UPI0023B23714|nr:fimbrial protein [Xenorhabdus bovienii]MDE9457053.1 fimbrial protein [Xenorhabdus bovienii]MDE9485057.1 fimbrial protein [Xenorhabdus bovienii]MDE9513153.1 fimbrial protein [Xenorhabdus bovienii]
MKTNLIISSLFVSSVFVSAAYAADGQIKFTGDITATACKIDPSSANQTVNMGTISSSSFNGVNSASAATRFSIILTDCPTEANYAHVKFDGNPDSRNNNLLALNNDDPKKKAADGVALGLYEADSATLISLAQPSRPQKLTNKSKQELNFIAKYIATNSTVNPGSGDAVANFTIVYN